MVKICQLLLLTALRPSCRYSLLTKNEVNIAGYWLSYFLRLTSSYLDLTCSKKISLYQEG